MELFKNAAEYLKNDYQCFLEYLELNEVKLSDRTGHIGKKDCFALNNQFKIVNERYNTYGRAQDYYAVIDFFYFFSVRAGILQIVKKKGKGLIAQRSQRYSVFSQMPSMEQYILMMTVWLLEYQVALSESFSFFKASVLFRALEGEKAEMTLAKSFEEETPLILGNYYVPEIRIFALFQLIRIEWLEKNKDDNENKYQIKGLYQTAEGCFIGELFKKEESGFWFMMDMKNILSVIKNITNQGTTDMESRLMNFWEDPKEIGLYTIILKVEINSCVRRIKLGDQFTLDDLHYMILKSVDFDSDHLYYFQVGSGTSTKRYYAPECDDDQQLADTVSLAELSMYEKMRFEYLYDFGDEWRFQITVEQILHEHSEEYEISTVKGEAPDQYGY